MSVMAVFHQIGNCSSIHLLQWLSFDVEKLASRATHQPNNYQNDDNCSHHTHT